MFLKIFLVIVASLQCAVADETYDKVNITYFYEARCPYCLQFIGDQLYSGYNKLSDYIDLQFVIAVLVSDDGIVCFHGENECFISRAQACALQRPGITQKLQVEYVHCTEAKAIQGDDVVESDIETCVNTILKDIASYETVKTCMDGDESVNLLKEYRQILDQHEVEYVPWLNVFGVHNDTTETALESNFVGTVCSLLSNPPNVCSEKL